MSRKKYGKMDKMCIRDSPSLDIQWENLEEAEVSEADKNHPLLKDVKP